MNSTALAPLRFLLDEALDESKTQESMVGIMEAQLLSRVGSAGWRRLPSASSAPASSGGA